MSKRLYIKTYGCQMNVYDSSRIADLFCGTKDYEMTDDPKKADVILVNSCSIREKAAEKMFSDMGRFRLLKKKNPQLIIGLGGCVPSHEKEAVFKRAPYLDLVFGPHTLHRLVDMVIAIEKGRKALIDTAFVGIEKFDALPEPKTTGPEACVTIMEGCDNFCSYCIVPYTRGPEVSRPKQDVLDEVSALTRQGAKEVTLLGQNVNHYYDEASKTDFAQLIEAVALNPAIERIRFMTSHPLFFSDALIQTYKKVDKLANHLHLPIQSGSDHILEAMRRGYTAQQFKDKIATLRTVRPHICVSSDFIVGFPGETDQDFEETLQLVNDIGFDHSFSFIYSPRPGTPAAQLEDNIPLKIKKDRLARLQAALTESEHKINQAMIGTRQKILVSGKAKRGSQDLMGRTENNRVVNFEGSADCIGHFVTVKITEALRNSLRGELCL